jgi:hypothetical protein
MRCIFEEMLEIPSPHDCPPELVAGVCTVDFFQRLSNLEFLF